MDMTTESLFFINNTVSKDWELFGYIYEIVVMVCSFGLILRATYLFRVGIKKNKKPEGTLRSFSSIHNIEDKRDLVWGSEDGHNTRIRDLEDTHLANIIHFLKKYPRHCGNRLMPILKEELEIRGLRQEFTDRSQIPYVNLDGKWEIWDFKKHQPMELEK